ncbi:hypothetical protein OESDEN_23404 [Oesophagostomum dentatum]|uniref:Polyprenyl synthetase n=1 Tax=Oesophagostomum dentatum TaxID=61180 RepID=A0A0B1RZ94_OESDE|nr:hypothetical protein OESDEN_23404 [Oesophagostomum dentatum]
MFRPTIALLMANACNVSAPKGVRLECGSEEISINQYKIGMISEMIHTASLVHDDVIDGADIRRGHASVNAIWGNKMVRHERSLGWRFHSGTSYTNFVFNRSAKCDFCNGVDHRGPSDGASRTSIFELSPF